MEKFANYLSKIARLLEIIISVVVLGAVVIQLFSLKDTFVRLVVETDSMAAFAAFLENILTLVIGLEFFRMLCFPEASTALEVILFLLARHLIVNENTSLDNLLTVIAIGIMVLANVLLEHWNRRKAKEDTGSAANAQDVTPHM